MPAYWSEEADIEDVNLLAEIGQRCGLLASDIVHATSEENFKRLVNANRTDARRERGVFRAPSFLCEGKQFWRNDRMDHLEALAARTAFAASIKPEVERGGEVVHNAKIELDRDWHERSY